MSGSPRQQPFLSLIESFLNRHLEVHAFCAKFTRLWMQDRDSTYAKKAGWPQPYDDLLLATWQRGEISDGEFRRASAELWGYAEDFEFQTMINEIHSAFSVFSPSPELEGEIDEPQFRREVERLLGDFQKPQAQLAQVI